MSLRYTKRDPNWVRFGSAPIVAQEPPQVFWTDTFDGTDVSADWGKQSAPFSAGNKESQWYQPANIVTSAGTCKIWSRRETITGSTTAAPAMSFATSGGPNYATPMTGLPAGSRPWSSGMMSTRDAVVPKYFPLFARFEIRARLPHGQGLLPAFWLRRKSGGASWGEVDIMEYFFNYRPGYTKMSLHFPQTLGVNATQQLFQFETPVAGTGAFHTWDMEIAPAGENSDPLLDPITFTGHCDGVQSSFYKLTDVQTIRDLNMIDRTTGQKIDPANPDLSWDICVNNAVGGQWVGQPDQQLGYLPIVDKCSRTQVSPPSGAGAAASCDLTGLFLTSFPALFEIDHVTVYELGA